MLYCPKYFAPTILVLSRPLLRLPSYLWVLGAKDQHQHDPAKPPKSKRPSNSPLKPYIFVSQCFPSHSRLDPARALPLAHACARDPFLFPNVSPPTLVQIPLAPSHSLMLMLNICRHARSVAAAALCLYRPELNPCFLVTLLPGIPAPRW
jgi:hypothetical protein